MRGGSNCPFPPAGGAARLGSLLPSRSGVGTAQVVASRPHGRNESLLAMSPRTRAAHDEFLRCQREDEEAGYQWWNDPEHPSYADAHASEDDEEDDESAALPPPDWRKREAEESEEENPRWRGIKDEGWD